MLPAPRKPLAARLPIRLAACLAGMVVEPAIAAMPLAVTQEAPGVYVHVGAVEDWTPEHRGDVANLGFVVGKRCVAVIDTGGTPQVGLALRAAIERETPLPVCYVINTHAHPYGIAIGGNDLGTPTASIMYCSAYGDGSVLVRGFGPAVFTVAPKAPNAAVNKAAGKGSPVTQEIAVSVKGDKVECSVNGTVVGSYDKATLVGPGKLKSTDGVWGIRTGHNTNVLVTGLAMTKG